MHGALHLSSSGPWEELYYFYGPCCLVIACNAVLFGLTARALRRGAGAGAGAGEPGNGGALRVRAHVRRESSNEIREVNHARERYVRACGRAGEGSGTQYHITSIH